MVDDLKSLKDNLFKVLASRGQPDYGNEDDDSDDAEEGSFMDSSAARAIISTLFAKAGKSKDEVIQILAREIGMAVAGMLKQPLSQLAKNQKLQITFEFVPKAEGGVKVSAQTTKKPQAKTDKSRPTDKPRSKSKK